MVTTESVVTSTSTNLRPFTNKDYTNDTVYRHGLARPMKWNYRLGKLNMITLDAANPNTYQVTNNSRYVKSSRTVPLIALTMDRPGHTINATVSEGGVRETCLTQNNLIGSGCCDNNAATNALRLVRGSNAPIVHPTDPNASASATSNKHYPSYQQYLRAGGKTVQQNTFHYANANSGGCDTTNQTTSIFKPNNEQYAQQGGVSSSSRTTRLTLNTIKTTISGQPVHKVFDTCRTGLPASMRASQRCR